MLELIMKTFIVHYDQRYKIVDNMTIIEAETLEEAKEKAHEFAQENSPTNYDFSNTIVSEVIKND